MVSLSGNRNLYTKFQMTDTAKFWIAAALKLAVKYLSKTFLRSYALGQVAELGCALSHVAFW